MGRVEDRHAGGFVHAAALHADEAVLDHVDPADAVAAADLVQRLDDLQRAELLAVDARPARPCSNAIVTGSTLSGAFCGETVMPNSTSLHAVDVQVFELARLVADVQAVFVAAVGLG